MRVADADPRDRHPGAGTERVLPAQLVLLALGFTGPDPGAGLLRPLGLRTGADGTLARGEDFTATGAVAPCRVYVAGDAGRGPSLIVWAIAEGRSAAAAVHRDLTGDPALPAPVTPASRALTA